MEKKILFLGLIMSIAIMGCGCVDIHYDAPDTNVPSSIEITTPLSTPIPEVRSIPSLVPSKEKQIEALADYYQMSRDLDWARNRKYVEQVAERNIKSYWERNIYIIKTYRSTIIWYGKDYGIFWELNPRADALGLPCSIEEMSFLALKYNGITTIMHPQMDEIICFENMKNIENFLAELYSHDFIVQCEHISDDWT